MNDTLSLATEVFKNARECNRCYPGEKICVPLPDPNNSAEEIDLLIVIERPGRQGAGKTGIISFDNGDPTADFLRDCFTIAGLSRNKIFISNACLCFPSSENYTDTKPTTREIENCLYWMRKIVDITKPRLIVAAGKSAWISILRLYGIKSKSNFLNCVGEVITYNDPWIFPVGHTSIRGRANRNSELQLNDWKQIPKIIKQFNNS